MYNSLSAKKKPPETGGSTGGKKYPPFPGGMELRTTAGTARKPFYEVRTRIDDFPSAVSFSRPLALAIQISQVTGGYEVSKIATNVAPSKERWKLRGDAGEETV